MTTPQAAIDLPSDDPRHRLADVVAYQHQELTPESRAAFEAHILLCPGCQKSVKLAAWAFPALDEAILKELPAPEAQVARLLEPEKSSGKAERKTGFLQTRWRGPVLWLIPLSAAAMVLLWFGPPAGTLFHSPSRMEAAPARRGPVPLGVRVTAVQTGSISLELEEGPGLAFVAVYANTRDGTVQRLKPRVANDRVLKVDLQPGSEWLLVLLGQGPDEPAGLDSLVISAVQKDPGIKDFPVLSGVARVARVAVPASVP